MPASRGSRARRLLICLALGALAPLGSISVGSFTAAAVVGIVLAMIAWLVWGMLDADDRDQS